MALELVGGALLSGLFQTLFERMASREVLDFFREKKLNMKILKKLKIMLLSANEVLNSAEEKQIRNRNVKEWLDELKEVTHELEDLMSEIKTEALSSSLNCKELIGSSRNSNKVLSLVTSSFTAEVEPEIEEIMERLELILSQKDVLGLKEGGLNRPSRSLLSPLVEESDIYGRNHDKDVIIQLLVSDNIVCGDKINVISIVGMGGIGKTTLAQLVFNDSRVHRHFDIKVWVSVSDDFDVFKITKTLFEKALYQSRVVADDIVDSEDYGAKDLHELQVKLKKVLDNKRFLFVLDDIWNENYDDWDVLKSPFGSGARGSRVVTTTRSEIAASKMSNVPLYHLQTITSADCWFLFARHAFNNTDSGAHPELEKIGKQIVKKCNDLPLAVKSLGGLLRSELNPKKWESILKSDIWEFSERECNILPALWLSYHYLPPHLKRCFAYCSVFPKNSKIEKENLVLLWMAEDLLQPQKGKRIEDLGEECFDTLISRSLLQRSSESASFFVMHDLVNDLAKFVAGKFCLTLENEASLSIGSNCIHHLSYDKRNIDGIMEVLISADLKSLRTFLPIGCPEPGEELIWNKSLLDELVQRVRYLRALSLSQYPINFLPTSIGDLRHLRYMNLSSTRLEVIPDEFCSLYNLQTLLLLGCHSLTKLPACMGSLINLRHLDIRGTKLEEMPGGMCNMKDLQTLTNFFLGKHSASKVKDLRELKNIRGGLSISGVENIIDVTYVLDANLKDKEYLSELSLLSFGSVDDSQKGKEILDGLQPHTNLKDLHIHGYNGTRFPSWIGHPSFSKMVSLSLSGCINCCFLPPLGQLPDLRKLYIARFSMIRSIGDEFYSNGSFVFKPFRSLEKLVFRHMPLWQEWSFPARNENEEGGGVFPCLRELHLQHCPRLIGRLPDRQIESLLVTQCENLSLRRQRIH